MQAIRMNDSIFANRWHALWCYFVVTMFVILIVPPMLLVVMIATSVTGYIDEREAKSRGKK